MTDQQIYLKSSPPVRVAVYSILLLIVFFINCNIFAQSSFNGLPEMVLPQGVGVNTHFITGGIKDHDMIAQAGIKFIRQDFFWYNIELEKGVYNWGPYDTLVQELDDRGIRGLFTLNLNNSLYSPNGTRWGPKDSDNIAAYARFAAEAAKRYKGHNIAWEFWNEPNGKNTWKPNENAAEYARLLLAACKAVREVDSNAVLVAPAMAGVHTDWLDTLFSFGTLKYVNGVSIHPYRDGPPPQLPETVGSPIKQVQDLIARYTPPGKTVFVVSGEWGYSTANLTTGVSLQTQADYIARMQLYNLYCGVPLTIWYDWKNDGTDLAQIGQNRGLVTADLTIKPSYVAMTTLTHQLSGYRILKRYDTGNSSDYVMVLGNSEGKVKLAAWTQGSARKVSFSLPDISFPDSAKTVWWVDGKADTGSVKIDQGKFTGELKTTPKYFSAFLPEPIPFPVPTVPVAVLPVEASTDVLRKATFKWKSSISDFAIRYHIQIARDSVIDTKGSFKAENIVFDSNLADTTAQLTNVLDANKKYYWHVSAVNLGGESNYSATRTFMTGSIISLPSTPVHLLPAQLSSDVKRNAKLVWRAAENAEKYRVQIATEYHYYTKGDSAGMFYNQNVVFDKTLQDTTVSLSTPLDSSYIYFWHVRAVNPAGVSSFSDAWKFTTGSFVDVVQKESLLPKKFALYQNYPNPFNPTTKIQYDIPQASHVRIKAYNMLGREVASLVDSRQAAGTYSTEFNASGLPSGVYLIRMSTETFSDVRKIMLVK